MKSGFMFTLCYLRDFEVIALLLDLLINSKENRKSSDESDQTFLKLRGPLTLSPFLASLFIREPFILDTDTSQYTKNHVHAQA